MIRLPLRLAIVAAVLPTAAGSAMAQSNIVSLIANAPTANTPSSASDLYLVIEGGIVKQATGVALQNTIASLANAPAAALPLTPGDALVVVQGGISKRVANSSTLNLANLTVGVLSVTGALSVPAGITIGGNAGIVITGSGGIASPGFSVDRLGNTHTQTVTLTPTLRPANPGAGRFVFYVDAFDNSLYVKGWLGTTKKLASP